MKTRHLVRLLAGFAALFVTVVRAGTGAAAIDESRIALTLHVAPPPLGNDISGSEDWSGSWTKNADGTWSRDWRYAFGVPANNFPFGVSDALIRRELVHVDGQTYYQVNPPNYTNRSGGVGSATEGDPGNPTNVNGGRLTPDLGENCFEIRPLPTYWPARF